VSIGTRRSRLVVLAVLVASAACTRVAVDLPSFDNIACGDGVECPSGAQCMDDLCVWPSAAEGEGEGEGPSEGEGEGPSEGEGEGPAEGEGEGPAEGEGEGPAEGEGEGPAEGEGEGPASRCESVCGQFELACGTPPLFCTPPCPYVSDVKPVWDCLSDAANQRICDQAAVAAHCSRPGLLGPNGAEVSPGCWERCDYAACGEGETDGCACEMEALCRTVCQELLGSGSHIQCLADRYAATVASGCSAPLAGFQCSVVGHDCEHAFPLSAAEWGTNLRLAEDNVPDLRCPAAPEATSLDEVFSFEVGDATEATLDVQAPPHVVFSLRPAASCTLPPEELARACTSDAVGCCRSGTGVLAATLQPGTWLVVVESPRALVDAYSATLSLR